MPSDPKNAAAGELRTIPDRLPLDQDGRDMGGENLFGMRVAGWREQSRHGPEFGYVTSYHWSTPGRGAKDVTRLFTEHEVRRRFAAALATPPDPAASQGEAGLRELRPEVLAFAHLMEAQLRANDHKPGWKGEPPEPLWERLREEATELLDVIGPGSRTTAATHHAKVGAEAADVANFAMMIADVCGALAAHTPDPGQAATPAESAPGAGIKVSIGRGINWSHETNEWADAACAGLQWAKNLRDGIGTPEQAVENLQACLKHCQEVTARAQVERAAPGADQSGGVTEMIAPGAGEALTMEAIKAEAEWRWPVAEHAWGSPWVYQERRAAFITGACWADARRASPSPPSPVPPVSDTAGEARDRDVVLLRGLRARLQRQARGGLDQDAALRHLWSQEADALGRMLAAPPPPATVEAPSASMRGEGGLGVEALPHWNDLTNDQRVAICNEGEYWAADGDWPGIGRDAAPAIYARIREVVRARQVEPAAGVEGES